MLNLAGAHWKIDFTEVRPGEYGYRCLLVHVDTFSGWTEAYLTRHETAPTVITTIPEEVLPTYGMPALLSSDKGPVLTTQVTLDG